MLNTMQTRPIAISCAHATLQVTTQKKVKRDQRRDRRTDQQTNKVTCRFACTRLRTALLFVGQIKKHFLVACTRLYKSPCRSVGRSVRPALRRSRFTFFCVVTCSVACAQLMAIGLVLRLDKLVAKPYVMRSKSLVALPPIKMKPGPFKMEPFAKMKRGGGGGNGVIRKKILA